MTEKENIEISHSEFRKLKEKEFGKKSFVIEGSPNISFGCGKELNIKSITIASGTIPKIV